MKAATATQLTIEVGRLTLSRPSPLPLALSVALTPSLYASTAFRTATSDSVDFATRLFLRVEAHQLEVLQNCEIVLLEERQGGEKRQLGRSKATATANSLQKVRVGLEGGGWGEAEVEFCASAVEVKQTKSINIRLSQFRSALAQKQSSPPDQPAPLPVPVPPATPPSSHSDTPTQTDPDPELLKRATDTALIATLQSRTAQLDLKLSQLNAQLTQKQVQLLGEKSKLQLLETERKLLQTKCDEWQAKCAEYQLKCDQMNLNYEQLHQKWVVLQKQEGQARASVIVGEQRIEEGNVLLRKAETRSRELAQDNQQLVLLLALEEERSGMAIKHVQKLNSLLEKLGTQEGTFTLIEQKDEIIMLNEELEAEIAHKNQIVQGMKTQIAELHAKINAMETAKTVLTTATNSVEPSSHKKIPPMPKSPPIGEIDKTDKAKPIMPRDSQKTIPVKRNFEKEPVRPKQPPKKQQKPVKKEEVRQPMVKSTREIRSPSAKVESPANLKAAKGKGVSKSNKIEQKSTMETEKRSSAQSCLSLAVEVETQEPTNLMLNSRNLPTPESAD